MLHPSEFLSVTSHLPDNYPLNSDTVLLIGHGLHFGIFRNQGYRTLAIPYAFESRLITVDQCHNDIPVPRSGRSLHNHRITVQDPGPTHGVAPHPQSEAIGAQEEISKVERVPAGDRLDGTTSGDAANQRKLEQTFCGITNQTNAPLPARRQLDTASLGQGLNMPVHRSPRAYAHSGRYFCKAWRLAVTGDMPSDQGERLTLAPSQHSMFA